MSCVLRARGADFDVDEFLSRSTLRPIVIARRGQPQYPGISTARAIPNDSGFHAVASEADFSDVKVQITVTPSPELKPAWNELTSAITKKEGPVQQSQPVTFGFSSKEVIETIVEKGFKASVVPADTTEVAKEVAA